MADYPLDILPQPSYPKPYPINRKVDEEKDLAILRRCDCPREKAFRDGVEDVDHITDFAFRNINEMSVNLLEGHFKPEDAFWTQKGKASDEWVQGTSVDIAEYEGLYEPTEVVPLFFLKVATLHDVEFKHPRRADSIENLELFRTVNDSCDKAKGVRKIAKGNYEADVEGVIKVNHRPTNLNYWHFQIEVYSIDKDGNHIPYKANKYNVLRSQLLTSVKGAISAII